MRSYRFAFAFCMAFAGTLLTVGCSPRATVIDIGKNETRIKKARLENRAALSVRRGTTDMELDLRDVRAVHIFMQESITHGRKLYFLAKIELKDGAIMTPNPNLEKTEEMIFVCVDDALLGRAGKGRVRIGLESIATVTFE